VADCLPHTMALSRLTYVDHGMSILDYHRQSYYLTPYDYGQTSAVRECFIWEAGLEPKKTLYSILSQDFPIEGTSSQSGPGCFYRMFMINCARRKQSGISDMD
jgi:hypothetical protein